MLFNGTSGRRGKTYGDGLSLIDDNEPMAAQPAVDTPNLRSADLSVRANDALAMHWLRRSRTIRGERGL